MVADAREIDTGTGNKAYLNEDDTKERFEFQGGFSGRERNHFFVRKKDNPGFIDFSFSSGLDFMEDGRAALPFDFDQDGDLDLVTLSLHGIRVLMNIGFGSTKNYLRLEFEDPRAALGAQIDVWTGDQRQVRTVKLEGGFHSQQSLDTYFGLGKFRVADRVKVTWPDGQRRVLRNLGGHLRIDRDGKVTPIRIKAWTNPPRPPTKPHQQNLRLTSGAEEQLISKNGPTIINFWAPWCKACVREVPQLNRVASSKKGTLNVVGVSVETKDLKGVSRFIAKHKPKFKIGYATDEIIEAYFGSDGKMDLPATFVFDDEERLIRVFRSEVDAQRIISAVGRVPLTAEDYLSFGLSIQSKEKAEIMLRALTRSAEIDKENPRAHWRLGKGFMAVEKFSEAKKAFLMASKLSTEDPEIIVDLALAKLNLDDKVGYRETLEEATKRGTSARAHNEYGQALEEQERLEDAAKEYNAAIKINPAFYLALVNLRRVKAKQKDGRGVRALTEQLTKLGYKEPKQKPGLNTSPSPSGLQPNK
ncbi:MAG: ASPIC/UnbV domain-containing protein [Myxococcota bacterium]|nr:ASPIC/UnbV domain-containing protein [Myxococcota bacterium]